MADGERAAGDGANGSSGDRRVAMELGMVTRMEAGRMDMGGKHGGRGAGDGADGNGANDSDQNGDRAGWGAWTWCMGS